MMASLGLIYVPVAERLATLDLENPGAGLLVSFRPWPPEFFSEKSFLGETGALISRSPSGAVLVGDDIPTKLAGLRTELDSSANVLIFSRLIWGTEAPLMLLSWVCLCCNARCEFFPCCWCVRKAIDKCHDMFGYVAHRRWGNNALPRDFMLLTYWIRELHSCAVVRATVTRTRTR